MTTVSHLSFYARANTRVNNYNSIIIIFIMIYANIFSLHILLISGIVCQI